MKQFIVHSSYMLTHSKSRIYVGSNNQLAPTRHTLIYCATVIFVYIFFQNVHICQEIFDGILVRDLRRPLRTISV